MDQLPIKSPVDISVSAGRKTLRLIRKVNTFDLEVCVPKGLVREQPFWRPEKVDLYHLLPDDSIKHTPG